MNLINKYFNIKNHSEYNGLADEINVLLIKEYYENNNENILILTNTIYEANKLFERLKNYIELVFLFPMDDFITDMILASSPELKIKRLETLSNISNHNHVIVITNLYGYIHKLPSIKEANSKFKIFINKEIKRNEIINTLDNYGYTRSSIVTTTGEYALRGFIIDVFPIGEEHPIRIELFGDLIDSIRIFDENTQLSVKDINEYEIKPFSEIKTESHNSLYDYLYNPLTIVFDKEQIKVSFLKLQNDIISYKEEKNEDITYEIYDLADIKPKKEIKFNTLNDKESDVLSHNIDNFNSDFALIKNYVEKNIYQNKTVIFCLSNDKQIEKIKDEFVNAIIISDIDGYEINKINICKYKINNGFIINDLVVISDNDIEKTTHSNIKYKNTLKIGKRINSFDQLAIGDYIVHQMHGIGIYNGVVTLTRNNIKQDYIQLIYQGNDKIYIPIDKINTIFKYTFKDGAKPKLNKLNSTDWEKKKLQIRNKINDISDELIELYSERNNLKCDKYANYAEEDAFASEFAFNPTNDQLKVINDIFNDLSSEKPMDRLLCGDVGYGKTEVAFRAMFKTVINNHQVAYLCPTTILSKQQYNSCIERFKNYPVNIKLLNRFTTAKEVKKIFEGLENGSIDIVFGTHRLFNEQIKYKNLGLLIIDEEQRFGVMHKEKIKEMKKNVNVLTLSATPIPRTLKMALSGIRDLSIIDTPPVNRYPVQTYVVAENDLLIREAIYKELSRNGQTFILYNYVSDILEEVNHISKLVPEARIRYAHGQMNKTELEDIMQDFIDYKFDILLCTTIIETGIDIPNANTLIIIDSDKFGLSQLYQIRGRVGRSDKIAYAYLMYKKSKVLTDTAMKRLKSIQEFTELGSGYRIAMRDLAIRGAGDLLGSEQAGFIDSIGIDLYMKMINETINHVNGEEEEKKEETPSLINVDNHIDSNYVSDEDIIIEIHKKISEIDNLEKLEEVRKELIDRFGCVNENIQIYMYQKLFEKKAKTLGINQINQSDGMIELILPEDISEKIKPDQLFFQLSSIDPSITIKYQFKKFYITLYTRKFKKHFIYYLLDIVDLFDKK